MKEKFVKMKDTPLSLCLRSSIDNLFLPRVNKQAIHSFFFTGIKEWNSLPSKIKESKNKITFKSRTKDHIYKELENKEFSSFMFYV